MKTKNVKKVKDEIEKSVSRHCLPMYGPFGVMMLFVFASIAYSTYIVAMGTNGLIPKVMLVPQALFALTIAIYKFSK